MKPRQRILATTKASAREKGREKERSLGWRADDLADHGLLNGCGAPSVAAEDGCLRLRVFLVTQSALRVQVRFRGELLSDS